MVNSEKLENNNFILYEDIIAIIIIISIVFICALIYLKVHNIEIVLGLLGLGLIMVGTSRQIFFAFKKGNKVTDGHSVIFLVCMCLANLLRLLVSRDEINTKMRSSILANKITAIISISSLLVSLFYLIMIWCVAYFNKKDNEEDRSNKSLAISIRYCMLIVFILVVLYLGHWSYP